MAGLLALADLSGLDVSSLAPEGLSVLRHRGSQAIGIATPEANIVVNDIQDFRRDIPKTSRLIGCCSNRLPSNNVNQPAEREHVKCVLDGRLVPGRNQSDALQILETYLGSEKDEFQTRVFDILKGSFSFAILDKSDLLAFRCPTGVKPLYIGKKQSLVGLASERKALWRVGIDSVESLSPGSCVSITKSAVTTKQLRVITRVPAREISIDNAGSELATLLTDVTRDHLSSEDIGIAFSGGLDSGLLGHIVKTSGTRCYLVTVGPRSIEASREAAALLNLPLLEVALEENIEEITKRVIWHTEVANPMIVSISIPFFLTAGRAKEAGLKLLMAGQGADELFGGYSKYVTTLSQKGAEAVSDEMFSDVVRSYRVNYEPAEQAVAAYGIELVLPFADMRLIEYALSLPVGTKLHPSNDTIVRKAVLKKAAELLGVPTTIFQRPKKAVQYSTGVLNQLRKLSSASGLGLEAYTRKLFSEVFGRTALT